jgi:hypothetical protein
MTSKVYPKTEHCWTNGNLPKINSVQYRLEEIQHGLRLATGDHTYAEPALEVLPRIRALCDAAKALTDLLENMHGVGCGCDLCTLGEQLWLAWCRLDNDRIPDRAAVKQAMDKLEASSFASTNVKPVECSNCGMPLAGSEEDCPCWAADYKYDER